MKPTINTKKIKIDGKSYTLRALTIKQIRPIIASDYTDDISIAAYLAAEGTEEIADMEFVENQPVVSSHTTQNLLTRLWILMVWVTKAIPEKSK